MSTLKARFAATAVAASLLIPIGAQNSSAITLSGLLGAWSTNSKSISTPTTIAQVTRADGIYMAGDSISVATGHQLATMLLPSGNLLAVNNWSGRPTTPAVTDMGVWLRTYGGTRRILMATGTNDIFAPSVMAAQISRLMAAAGPSRHVYWVTVYISRWSKSAAVQAADRANARAVNIQIYAAAKRYPNLTVIPWDVWMASNTSRPRLYLRDGVHTNAAGSLFRNTIIRAALLR